MDVEARFSRARLAEASDLTEPEVASCEAAGLVGQQHGGLGTVIEARPGEVLVSEAVLADHGLIDEIELEEIGEVSLTGVPMPVVRHRARARRTA